MDRIRSLFANKVEEQEYAPLRVDTEDSDAETLTSLREPAPFSWMEYLVFLLLGVAMLWAW
jgi:solute carrier family 29 (equilibrative nucleoside transporter), member 1/2/3